MKAYTRAEFLAMHKSEISGFFPRTAYNLDEERFFAPGGMGEAIAVNIGYSRSYTDEMDPELVNFWAHYDKGLKKEKHHGNSVWPESRMYITYTPMAAFTPEGKNRRFPMIVLLTGEAESPFYREGFGFCHMAAKNEVIVLAPASVSEMGVLAAIREAVDDMPVDPTRIYLCGFSNGSFRTQEFSIVHPDLIAASCSFGTEPYASIRWEPNHYMRHHLPDGQVTIATSQRTIKFSPQVYQAARAHMVPFIHIMGCCEAVRMIPFYNAVEPENYVFYHSVEYKVEQINRKLWINHCPLTDIKAVRASKNSENKVERIIGMPFDDTHIEVYHNGVEYYFGDIRSEDGVVRSRFVGVENMPHTCGGAYADIAWDFLRNFTRGPSKMDKFCDEYHHTMLAAYPETYWPLKHELD